MDTSRTIDHAGIEWDVRNNPCHTDEVPPFKAYCADGDGVVTVYEWSDRFTIEEQFDPVATHNTLEEALDHAVALLATNYPAIYAEFHFAGPQAQK